MRITSSCLSTKFLNTALLLLASCTCFSCIAQTTERIKLNQLGFYPNGPKLAVITGETDERNFYITSTNLLDTFFHGKTSEQKQSAYSKTITTIADFSGFNKKGSYVVTVPGVGSSYAFKIENDVYREAAIATLKGFYYQRVSTPLDPVYAGKWHRSQGHPDNIVYVHSSAATDKRPEGTVISSPYGWYDAGDYNKYVVNSGISMGTLFSAYEDFPSYFSSLKTNIPESGDAVPDVLNEALYNLRWMLTMQDPFDGGVYHKCTNAVFDGMVMPGVTKAPRYVVAKSTAATLDFAAVTAQAARIFKQYSKTFPGLADSCLRASTEAWGWAQKNPSVLYEQEAMNQKFKPAVTTGSYGDRSVKDEWFWAAVELFATTKQPAYFDIVKERMPDRAFLPNWGNVAMLSYYSFIRLQSSLPANAKTYIEAMKDTVLRMADTFLVRAERNAFATVMGQTARDYSWGGNSVAANQGILLVRAFLLTGKKKYFDGALSNLDYILGRNATGYSFITGIGSKPPMHPHHRQSESDGITEPVPGLMVGGPNIGMQDRCTYEFKEIETAYLDGVCSYASNEIAINWNASAVYLTNAIEALKQKAGYLGGTKLSSRPTESFGLRPVIQTAKLSSRTTKSFGPRPVIRDPLTPEETLPSHAHENGFTLTEN